MCIRDRFIVIIFYLYYSSSLYDSTKAITGTIRTVLEVLCFQVVGASVCLCVHPQLKFVNTIRAYLINHLRVFTKFTTTLVHFGMRYFRHIMRSNGSCLEKEIIHGTLPGRTRGRPHMSWMDNIQTWTGLETGMLLRAVDDRLQ